MAKIIWTSNKMSCVVYSLTNDVDDKDVRDVLIGIMVVVMKITIISLKILGLVINFMYMIQKHYDILEAYSN